MENDSLNHCHKSNDCDCIMIFYIMENCNIQTFLKINSLYNQIYLRHR